MHDLRTRVALSVAGVFAVAVGALFPAFAQADTAILSFSALPSTTRAGAHPDFSVSFSLSSHQTDPTPCACTDAKNVTAHLPTGFIGNPHATPQCDIAQFASDLCPVDSQVGIARVLIASGQGNGTGYGTAFITPVYSLIPPPSEPALLGFKSGAADSPTFEVVSARTDSDYGLDVETVSIEHFFPPIEFQQVTWGVPADPIHDYLRFGFGQPAFLEFTLGGPPDHLFCDKDARESTDDPATVFQLCTRLFTGPIGDIKTTSEGESSSRPIPSNSPLTPFLQSPTTCGETSLFTSLDVLSYDTGTSHADSTWPATTDCDQLSFNPSQAIEPTTTAADSPSGAEFRLTVPQFESPFVPSPSELRAATVTLPAGFALAPNVMNGKTTCSGAEARFGTREEAQCPENAKIGTISVDTPVLPGPLGGAAYLGEPLPGNRYRLFLVFDGFGVHVKLAGTVSPDPQTGQIRISFSDLPQAPFEIFNMHVFGSERGPLATPTRCGIYEVQSHWTAWDSSLPDQTSRQFFTIDQGPDGKPCPGPARPFNPGVSAGVANISPAAHTSFSLNLTRNDGDQNIAGLSITTPPGFTATLKGIPYCPQAASDQLANPLYLGTAELSSPLCAASQIGTVTTGVGAGSHPLYLPGKVYLAGPYKGAPLSFLVVIPAVSGPYDLGNVAVRAAVKVNPESAQATTVSDPLPEIVGGIPIRTRQVLVHLDRPGFILNPTNCDPLAVNVGLSGDEGADAKLSSHFQVANCASLPFGPKLSLKLTGGVRRLGHPAIHAILTAKPGEANTRSISVTLPSSELLDNDHIVAVCTKVDFAKQSCPAGSQIGQAEVTTPLLDQPLRGSAYLRSSGKGLPDLALDLYGQFHIEAVAQIDSVNGGLRTTFKTVPDVPLGSVALDLEGGSKGLIRNSESLCGANKKASVTMRGQNGKRLQRSVPLQASCGKAGKRHRLHRAIRAGEGGGR